MTPLSVAATTISQLPPLPCCHRRCLCAVAIAIFLLIVATVTPQVNPAPLPYLQGNQRRLRCCCQIQHSHRPLELGCEPKQVSCQVSHLGCTSLQGSVTTVDCCLWKSASPALFGSCAACGFGTPFVNTVTFDRTWLVFVGVPLKEYVGTQCNWGFGRRSSVEISFMG